MKSATVARRWFPLKNHKFLSLHLMLFNYVLQHNLHCPFHFWLDQTKQKSCIITNVMLGSRTRTQFSICFNQQNSFAPVFMIASNWLYFYFSKVPIIFYSAIFASNVTYIAKQYKIIVLFPCIYKISFFRSPYHRQYTT